MTVADAPLPVLNRNELRRLMVGEARHAWFGLWTNDPAETILRPDYWVPAREVLQVGDRIDCICLASSGEAQHVLLVVDAILTDAGPITLRAEDWLTQNAKQFTRPPMPRTIRVKPLHYWTPPLPRAKPAPRPQVSPPEATLAPLEAA